jgi:hypothetical protein
MTYDFATRFEKLSGIVHRVGTEAAAAATIADICQRRQAGCIALAGLAPAMVGLIEESCTQACPELSVLTEPYASAALPLAIDRADVGVTGIAFAIAQSGTMVEVADNDATRLVSSLAPRPYRGGAGGRYHRSVFRECRADPRLCRPARQQSGAQLYLRAKQDRRYRAEADPRGAWPRGGPLSYYRRGAVTLAAP